MLPVRPEPRHGAQVQRHRLHHVVDGLLRHNEAAAAEVVARVPPPHLQLANAPHLRANPRPRAAARLAPALLGAVERPRRRVELLVSR